MPDVQLLKNNLKTFLIPLHHLHSLAITLYIKAGSRFESQDQQGAAHLLEHLSLRKSKQFRNKLKIAKHLDKFGIKVSAATGKEAIHFTLKTLNTTKSLSAATDMLRELVFETQYEERLFNLEKEIIVNELRQKLDNPNRLLNNWLNQATWPNHRFGQDNIGELDRLKSLQLEDILVFRQSFFKPQQMVFGIAGSFDKKQVENLLSGFEKHPSLKTPDTVVGTYLPQQQFGCLKWIRRENDRQARFQFYFKGFSSQDDSRFSLGLLTTILGGGFGSRFFQAVREKKGLAYSMGSFYRAYSDTGILGIKGVVREDNLVEAIKVVKQEIDKIKREGISKEELSLAKTKVKSSIALSLESPSGILGWYAPQFLLCDRIETYEKFCQKLDSVNRKEVHKIAQKVLAKGQFNFAFTANNDQSQALQEILQVRG